MGRILEKSKHVGDRAVTLLGNITKESAERVVSRILELEQLGKNQDIWLFLNSSGGDVKAGLAIYQAMQDTACDVVTVCSGRSESMAAVLLAAGTFGKRIASSDSRISLHEPWDLSPSITRLETVNRMLASVSAAVTEILHHHTGQPVEIIRRDSSCGRTMQAADAKFYGLIDVIYSRTRINRFMLEARLAF